MEALIATYGYPAILVGTFLEGETVVLAAGYLASLGYLSLPLVAICAFLGTWIGDSTYFFIGRRWGATLLEKRPGWRPAAGRALRLLHRYHAIFILSFRFVYGIRTMSPFAIGMSGVSPLRFVLLNMVASAIWAVLFSSVGHLVGSALSSTIEETELYEVYVLAVIVGLGMLLWLAQLLIVRRRRRATGRLRQRKGQGDGP
jgi:membrane protein DedA with SNARE-associated domain